MKTRKSSLNKLLVCFSFAITSLTINAQNISTIAGTGTAGYNSDGILATTAQLNRPWDMEIDPSGNVYISDYTNQRIRKIDATTGLISTIAGTGTQGYNGDGILATTAQINGSSDIFLDAGGNLYIAEFNGHRIRKIDVSTGLISTIAGTGTAGYNGDGILATTAQLNSPVGIHVDVSGNIFLCDYNNSRIRRIDAATGIINTIAGTGVDGYNGDGILATAAQVNGAAFISLNTAGDIYLGEWQGARARKIDVSTGLISTIAGTGTAGYNGDGIVASSAQLGSSVGVKSDAAGNVYISDSGNDRIRKIDASTGFISTIAGTGTPGYNGDGIPATTAQINDPYGINIDASGTVYFAEFGGHRIRKIDFCSATDVTPPVADVATLTNATGQCSVTPTAPTATDACAGSITGTTTTTFPITAQGTTTITWTYNDGNGNSSTQTQNVVINDNTAPVADATTLTDSTATCSLAAMAAPTATDNCVGSVTGTTTTTFPITAQGTTTVTWTFDDGNGNTSTQTQDVVITDNVAPVADATTLADSVATCSLAAMAAPTATDNCVGSVTGTSTTTFPITAQGTTTVTWIFDDGNGNTSTQTQDVVINALDTMLTLSGDTITANAAGYTYQWIDCDNNNDSIIGATGQSFVPSTGGNYAVIISNGICTDTSGCAVSTVSISEISFDSDVKLYPNPTTGNVNLNFGQALNAGSVIINDMTGKQVYSIGNLNKQTLSLDINHFSKGVYFVKVQNNNQLKVIKLIKQ